MADSEVSVAVSVFVRAVEAIREGALIRRASAKDKEFHFQNWFADRLQELDLRFDPGGRNSYPDFHMVRTTDGFELRALRTPVETPPSIATARCQRVTTTVGTSTTCWGDTRRSLMV